MSEIEWRDAVHADRSALQDFVCTPEAARRQYGRAAPPRPNSWELVAQSAVRDLRPPAKQGHTIVVGVDAEGIVAAAHAEEDGSPDVAFIPVLAVALRMRGRPNGAKLGERILDELIDRLASRADAAGYDHLVLWGKVHPRNAAARKMCERTGWDTYDRLGLFDRWQIRVDFRDY